MELFTETDLQQVIGDTAYREWLADQVLEARADGLWFPADRATALDDMSLAHVLVRIGERTDVPLSRTIFQHPQRDLNRPVLPFPFSLSDFKAFALHPRFDLRDLWTDVHPDDTEALDEAGIAAVVQSHRPAAELFAALFPAWAAGNGRRTLDVSDQRTHKQGVRHLVLHPRLRPTSAQFRGGRVTHVDVLSLSEAAAMAARHAEVEISISDFLRAAARGEILLRAVVHRRAKVVKADGGVCINAGHPTDENTIPEGSIPTLPVVACSQLANTGRASWRTFDEVEADEDGQHWRTVKFQLEQHTPDYETVLEDCRVVGYDVHALADAFKDGEPEQSNGEQVSGAATGTPPFEMLATRQQLVDAFGRFVAMDLSWFERLNDIPALKAARKIPGRPGRTGHASEPMFCPYEVMTFVMKQGRKVRRPLSPEKAWKLLEDHFPRVHAARQIGDPRP